MFLWKTSNFPSDPKPLSGSLIEFLYCNIVGYCQYCNNGRRLCIISYIVAAFPTLPVYAFLPYHTNQEEKGSVIVDVMINVSSSVQGSSLSLSDVCLKKLQHLDKLIAKLSDVVKYSPDLIFLISFGLTSYLIPQKWSHPYD